MSLEHEVVKRGIGEVGADLVNLWRPVGIRELALVFESAMRAFPPRLPGQPIFYPVLAAAYADQIAREWNAPTDPFAGYVVRFEVRDEFAREFGPHVVGGPEHSELWVPADRLDEFNEAMRTPIVVERGFFGKEFTGHVPDRFGLRGANALEQPKRLLATLDHSRRDFGTEIAANALAIFVHHPFWKAVAAERLGLGGADRNRLLAAIDQAWSARDPALPSLPQEGILVG